jgi:glucose/arabinose dehydrogenase
MSTHPAISVAMVLGFTATLAMMGTMETAVRAQAPAAPAQQQTPAAPAQPKVNLTLEQRHTIKEIIKDLNVPSAPKDVETTVGATVPAAIKLSPMPVDVAQKVPSIKSHLFFVEDGKVVIVDPKENKIVDAID